MHPRFDALIAALRQEEQWQKRELEQALSRPWAERIALGVSWPSVRSEEAGLVRARAPLHDGIRAGDPILAGDLPGWVEEVDGPVAELSLPRDAVLPSGDFEVSLRFDPTPWKRGHIALRRADETQSRLREELLGEPPDERPRLSLLHGPPGTGKTWTSARRLQAWVEEGDRPWALADSNAAADNLALATAGLGLRVLRLGRPARIGAAAKALSLERQVDEDPSVQAVTRVLSRARGPERSKVFRELQNLKRSVRRHRLDDAQVLVSTLSTLVRAAPDLPVARHALIDEATQAMEPLLWAPVPYVQELLLVGDPHQLGPVIKQPSNPLEADAFTRLVARRGAPMLEVQYRMDRRIQALVQHTYGPAYRPSPEVSDHGSAPIWVDTAGAGMDEQRDPVTLSLHNPGEVRVVSLAVQQLREQGLHDIGIIAPYSAQVQRIRQRHPELEVATVNSFQGREKQAIVCSFVRSNEQGELGFVSDPRRLTVALTRARQALVLIGDSATLCSAPDFARLHEAVGPNLRSVWDDPWAQAMES